MFQLLCFFGPAAIIYTLSSTLSGQRERNYFLAFARFLAYGTVNLAVTVLILYPYGKIHFLTLEDGTHEICFGGFSFFIALLVSVVLAVVFAVIQTKICIGIEATDRSEAKAQKAAKKNESKELRKQRNFPQTKQKSTPKSRNTRAEESLQTKQKSAPKSRNTRAGESLQTKQTQAPKNKDTHMQTKEQITGHDYK